MIHTAGASERGRVWEPASWDELEPPDVVEVLHRLVAPNLPPDDR